MATTFDEVRTLIDEEITTNGQQEITGQVLNNVLTEMTDVTEEKLTELESKGVIIKSVGTYDGNSAWHFYDLNFVSGKKYLIKLMSGEGSGRVIGIGSQSSTERLIIEEWVEITAPATGNPFIYITGGAFVDAPILLVTGADNELVKDSIIPLESFIITQSLGVASGNAWVFNDLVLSSGKKYLIKLVSGQGEGRPIGVGSSSSAEKLNLGRWVEITAPSTGTPFIYVGGNFADTPILQVTGINNALVKDSILPLEEKTTIVKDIEIIKSTGTHDGGSAWIFNDLSLVSGKKYLIKLTSGEGNGRPIAIGASTSTEKLILGKWVEITAPATGNPYIYITGGAFVDAPLLEITSVENTLVKDSILPLEEKTSVVYHTINVSRDGTSKVGRNIHFSGLNAIADALNSITDATENNRYIVHVEGEFHFTDPLTLTMTDAADNPEYSVIVMKPYVEIEGDGADKSVIFVDFPANATFHNGHHYNDYQPLYFNGVGGKIRNMKIAGKNCRYALHIDTIGAGLDKTAFGAEILIENCSIVSYGAPDYGGEMNAMGTGIYDGQRWNIKNCEIINYRDGGTSFAVHPYLNYFKIPPVISFENCTFKGDIGIHNYQTSNNTIINFNGCTFTKGVVPIIHYPYYNNKVFGALGDYTTMNTNGNDLRALFNTKNLDQNDGKGCVLHIASKSDDKVRFDKDSSAFNIVVGNSLLTAKLKTNYYWDTQYGYVYRDGGNGINSQAFGTIDIDEHSSGGHTLGKLLGDCSAISKSLGIYIGDRLFNVTFSENYTNTPNAYIIEQINSVIGDVAEASVFSPAELYYPIINGLCEVISADDGAILKGMGVVFGANGMRRAKSTDGYIDGICLDDTISGQTGRVITKGYIYSARTWTRFSTYDRNAQQIAEYINEGQTLGINPNIDGQFFVNATPALLRCKKQNVLEIVE